MTDGDSGADADGWGQALDHLAAHLRPHSETGAAGGATES